MTTVRFGILGALLALTAACGGALHGGTPITPVPPTRPPVRGVGVVVTDDQARPVAGAVCGLDGATDQGIASNGDGYILFPIVPASLRDTQLTCTAKDFVDLSEHRVLTKQLPAPEGNENLAPAVLHRAHVDPAQYSPQQLEAFRGALFTVKACSLPYGPRPGQPDNIVFFASSIYTREQRQCGYDAWKARAYTHGVVGPFIDPGYHGQTQPVDIRSNPDASMDLIQEVYDQHLIPVVAIVPDHWGADKGFGDHIWTVDDLRGSDLEAIYKSPRFQQLARVVMLCWECQGSKYGWSTNQYVEYLTWLRDTFPNAVRVLHTISDIEAPVGNGDDTSRPGHSNGESWARVTALVHAWFHQSSSLFDPTHVDPSGDGRTDEAHWFDLFDASKSSSLVSRFTRGVAGWPTTSANPPDVNGGHLCVVAAEFYSFVVYWQNASEDYARDHGARALQLGACGVMDGVR